MIKRCDSKKFLKVLIFSAMAFALLSSVVYAQTGPMAGDRSGDPTIVFPTISDVEEDKAKDKAISFTQEFVSGTAGENNSSTFECDGLRTSSRLGADQHTPITFWIKEGEQFRCRITESEVATNDDITAVSLGLHREDSGDRPSDDCLVNNTLQECLDQDFLPDPLDVAGFPNRSLNSDKNATDAGVESYIFGATTENREISPRPLKWFQYFGFLHPEGHPDAEETIAIIESKELRDSTHSRQRLASSTGTLDWTNIKALSVDTNSSSHCQQRTTVYAKRGGGSNDAAEAIGAFDVIVAPNDQVIFDNPTISGDSSKFRQDESAGDTLSSALSMKVGDSERLRIYLRDRDDTPYDITVNGLPDGLEGRIRNNVPIGTNPATDNDLLVIEGTPVEAGTGTARVVAEPKCPYNLQGIDGPRVWATFDWVVAAADPFEVVVTNQGSTSTTVARPGDTLLFSFDVESQLLAGGASQLTVHIPGRGDKSPSGDYVTETEKVDGGGATYYTYEYRVEIPDNAAEGPITYSILGLYDTSFALLGEWSRVTNAESGFSVSREAPVPSSPPAPQLPYNGLIEDLTTRTTNGDLTQIQPYDVFTIEFYTPDTNRLSRYGQGFVEGRYYEGTPLVLFEVGAHYGSFPQGDPNPPAKVFDPSNVEVVREGSRLKYTIDFEVPVDVDGRIRYVLDLYSSGRVTVDDSDIVRRVLELHNADRNAGFVDAVRTYTIDGQAYTIDCQAIDDDQEYTASDCQVSTNETRAHTHIDRRVGGTTYDWQDSGISIVNGTRVVEPELILIKWESAVGVATGDRGPTRTLPGGEVEHAVLKNEGFAAPGDILVLTFNTNNLVDVSDPDTGALRDTIPMVSIAGSTSGRAATRHQLFTGADTTNDEFIRGVISPDFGSDESYNLPENSLPGGRRHEAQTNVFIAKYEVTSSTPEGDIEVIWQPITGYERARRGFTDGGGRYRIVPALELLSLQAEGVTKKQTFDNIQVRNVDEERARVSLSTSHTGGARCGRYTCLDAGDSIIVNLDITSRFPLSQNVVDTLTRNIVYGGDIRTEGPMSDVVIESGIPNAVVSVLGIGEEGINVQFSESESSASQVYDGATPVTRTFRTEYVIPSEPIVSARILEFNQRSGDTTFSGEQKEYIDGSVLIIEDPSRVVNEDSYTGVGSVYLRVPKIELTYSSVNSGETEGVVLYEEITKPTNYIVDVTPPVYIAPNSCFGNANRVYNNYLQQFFLNSFNLSEEIDLPEDVQEAYKVTLAARPALYIEISSYIGGELLDPIDPFNSYDELFDGFDRLSLEDTVSGVTEGIVFQATPENFRYHLSGGNEGISNLLESTNPLILRIYRENSNSPSYVTTLTPGVTSDGNKHGYLSIFNSFIEGERNIGSLGGNREIDLSDGNTYYISGFYKVGDGTPCAEENVVEESSQLDPLSFELDPRVSIDLDPLFDDVSPELSFSVRRGDRSNIVDTTISGSRLSVIARKEGNTSLVIRATDPAGRSADQRIEFSVLSFEKRRSGGGAGVAEIAGTAPRTSTVSTTTTTTAVPGVGAAPSVSLFEAPSSAQTLTRGSTGTDVVRLQVFLNNLGGSPIAESGAGSAGNETNFFGPATESALSAYQEKNDLPVTGVYDEETSSYIENHISLGNQVVLLTVVVRLLNQLNELTRLAEVQ